MVLIKPEKVHPQPVLIKLSLKKNVVKSLDHHGSGSQHLKNNFKWILTDTKLEAGESTRSQICNVIHNSSFRSNLYGKSEKHGYVSLKLSKLFCGTVKLELKHPVNPWKTCLDL